MSAQPPVNRETATTGLTAVMLTPRNWCDGSTLVLTSGSGPAHQRCFSRVPVESRPNSGASAVLTSTSADGATQLDKLDCCNVRFEEVAGSS